jgi:hypothetical protein
MPTAEGQGDQSLRDVALSTLGARFDQTSRPDEV